MNNPRITYTPRPGTTPAGELSALCQIYAYILQKHEEEQKGTRLGAPDDVAKESNGYDANTNHTR